jgi:serine/threonine protein kinase
MVISLDRFMERLYESTLLSPIELRVFLDEFPPSTHPTDSDELARLLIRGKRLTPYQAAAIQNGDQDRLVLHEYDLLNRLGAGGMGEVFLAIHRRLQRTVAVKVISGDFLHGAPDAVDRFFKETLATGLLSHSNIVGASDAGEDKGVNYLVLEYVDGRSLSELLEEGPLSIEEAGWYVLQAARGFAHAHANGVVHRDVKPGNLLISRDGILKINDFGLARFTEANSLKILTASPSDEDLTRSDVFLGTYSYTAPEQALDPRDASPQSDIYSLGCTLYRAVVGRAIYKAETLMMTALAHRENPIPSLRADRGDASKELDDLFQRMVAKQPCDRFESMQEVVEALEACGPWEPVTTNAVEQFPSYAVDIPLRDRKSEGASPSTGNYSGPDADTRIAKRGEIFEGDSLKAGNTTGDAQHSSRLRVALISFVLLVPLLALLGSWKAGLLSGSAVPAATVAVNPGTADPGAVISGTGASNDSPAVPFASAPRSTPTANLQFIKAGQLTIGAGRKINAIGFMADSHLLYVVVPGGIELWDHQESKLVSSHPIAEIEEIKCASYDSESQRLVVGGRNGDVRMLEIHEKSDSVWSSIDNVIIAVNQVCMLPGGKQVFCVTNTELFLLDLDRAQKLQRASLTAENVQGIHDASISSDGSTAVLGCRNTNIVLWDIDNWRQKTIANTSFGSGKKVMRVAYAPDDESYFGGVFSSPDPSIMVQQFDIQGKLLNNFGMTPGSPIKTLAILPKYDLLISGIGSRLVGWNIKNGERIKSGHADFDVECLAVDESGLVAVANGTWTVGSYPGLVQLFRLEETANESP